MENRFSRITLNKIDVLVGQNKVEKIGQGKIRSYVFQTSVLEIKTSKEKRKFDRLIEIANLKGVDFLNEVNCVLKKEGLYISEVEYKSSCWDGFFPHKLKGVFYKDD